MLVNREIAVWMLEMGIVENPAGQLGDQMQLDRNSQDSFVFGSGFKEPLKKLAEDTGVKMKKLHGLVAERTPSAKVSNWTILFTELAALGITIDKEKQSVVLAGKLTAISGLLSLIYSEHRRIVQRRKTIDVVDLDAVKLQGGLGSARNCLEGVIVIVANSFAVTAKQAVALLAQSNQLLSHVVVQGFKQEFQPVTEFYLNLLEGLDRLCQLLASDEGVSMLLSVIQPSLISKSEDVASLGYKALLRFASLLNGELYCQRVREWLDSEGASILYTSLTQNGRPFAGAATTFMVKYLEYTVKDFIGIRLRGSAGSEYEFIQVLGDLLEHFQFNQSLFIESGLIDLYIQVGMSSAENSDSHLRHRGIRLLSSLWCYFEEYITSQSSVPIEILNILKRRARESSFLVQVSSIIEIFRLLLALYHSKNSYAPIIYKTLSFLFIELYRAPRIRELFTYNMLEVIEHIKSLPISTIVDPLYRQSKNIESKWNTFDFDFFIGIARHPTLNIESGIHMGDMLGKIYLYDLVYSRAAGIPLLIIFSRFIEKPLMQEYVEKYIKVILSDILSQSLSGSAPINIRRMDQETSRRLKDSLVIELIRKILEVSPENLQKAILEILLQGNYDYKNAKKSDHKGIYHLLSILGNPEEFLSSYRSSVISKQLVISRSASQQAITKSPLHYKSVPPNSKASIDIQDARKKRVQNIELKNQQEQILKTKTERLLFRAQKDVEKRKIELGLKEGSLVIEPEATISDKGYDYLIITKEPVEEQELLKRIVKKFKRPLKFYYNTFRRLKLQKRLREDGVFEDSLKRENLIDFTQLLNFIRTKGITPSALSRGDIQWYAMEWGKREKQAKTSYILIDWDGFLTILFQLSVWLERNNPSAAVLPPAYNFLSFVNRLKETEENRHLFDVGAGTGDPSVISYINAKLRQDPNFLLPLNYLAVLDYEFEIAHTIPDSLNIQTSYKHSIELLDEILYKSLSVHFLSPISKLLQVLKCKGTAKTVPIPLGLKASKFIKYSISLAATPQNINCLSEAGSVLEELLSMLEQNITQKRKIHEPNNALYNTDDTKWKNRQKELKSQLKTMIKEKGEKEQIENARKQDELIKTQERDKIQQDNRKKALEIKKKKIEDWKTK